MLRLRLAPSLLVVPLALLLAAGCASNRLARYDFQDRSIAVLANVPPRPEVFTGGLLFVDPGNLLATVARATSAVAKEVQANRARARLDSAMAFVDVAALLSERARDQGARSLRARPADDPRSADYVLDVWVREYGIDAESWQSQVHFTMSADVALLDASGRRIWKTRVQARDPIASTYFPGSAVGDVLSAEALSRLSVDEMAVALEHLAAFAADEVTRDLRHDLARARR